MMSLNLFKFILLNNKNNMNYFVKTIKQTQYDF